MNKINILFLIDKTRVNRNSKAPIRCRITYLKERKIFSTGLFINPKNWSSAKQQAVPLNTENTQINTQLSLIKQEINQAFLFLQVGEKSFDVEDIFRQYKGENIKEEKTIIDIFNLHILKQEKLIGISTTKVSVAKFHL